MAYYGYSNPNIFGPQKPKRYDFNFDDPEQNPYQIEQPVAPQERDFAAEYQKAVMQPDGPNTSAFMDYMAKGSPKESDYKPSKIRGLGAILAGGLAAYSDHGDVKQGLALSDHIIHDPYNRAVADYERRGKDLRGAADVEGASQTRQMNRLKAAYDAQQKERDDKRQDASALWTAANIRSEIEARKSAGWHYTENQKDGSLDAVKMNGDGTTSHQNIPLNHLTEAERAGIRSQAAIATAKAVEPIHASTQRALQNSSFLHSDAQQQKGFAHAERMQSLKPGPNQSITQVQAKNASIVDSIVQGDKKKYNSEVYGYDATNGTWSIKNPLADKGFPRVNPDDPNSDIDWTQLTDEEVKNYNAFVELHNANINGIDNTKKLNKITKPGITGKKPVIVREGFGNK